MLQGCARGGIRARLSLRNVVRFLGAAGSQFPHSQNQTTMSRRATKRPDSCAKGDSIMDYVVVFVTMLMVAGYACIIGRNLRGTE